MGGVRVRLGSERLCLTLGVYYILYIILYYYILYIHYYTIIYYILYYTLPFQSIFLSFSPLLPFFLSSSSFKVYVSVLTYTYLYSPLLISSPFPLLSHLLPSSSSPLPVLPIFQQSDPAQTIGGECRVVQFY